MLWNSETEIIKSLCKIQGIHKIGAFKSGESCFGWWLADKNSWPRRACFLCATKEKKKSLTKETANGAFFFFFLKVASKVRTYLPKWHTYPTFPSTPCPWWFIQSSAWYYPSAFNSHIYIFNLGDSIKQTHIYLRCSKDYSNLLCLKLDCDSSF